MKRPPSQRRERQHDPQKPFERAFRGFAPQIASAYSRAKDMGLSDFVLWVDHVPGDREAEVEVLDSREEAATLLTKRYAAATPVADELRSGPFPGRPLVVILTISDLGMHLFQREEPRLRPADPSVN
jgi:hypothetical protein